MQQRHSPRNPINFFEMVADSPINIRVSLSRWEWDMFFNIFRIVRGDLMKLIYLIYNVVLLAYGMAVSAVLNHFDLCVCLESYVFFVVVVVFVYHTIFGISFLFDPNIGYI